MQESIDQMTPWFEWVRWKHHQLLDARRHDLAISFMEDVLKVMRAPVAALAVVTKKGMVDCVKFAVAQEELSSGRWAFGRQGPVTLPLHRVGEWLDANPDPFRETLATMAGLKERWGEETGLPKEPAG